MDTRIRKIKMMVESIKSSRVPESQINSEKLYTAAFQNVVGRYGKEFTWDLKIKTMGKQSKETAKKIIDALELPLTIDKFIVETEKQFVKIFPDANLMPGAQRLLEHLHKNNIPIALATSSNKDISDLKLQKHTELFKLFNHKIFGSSDPEVKRGKPEPDIFLVCASKFSDNPDPGQCLVFEDALNGVLAAKAAGMQSVMVPDPKLDKDLTKEATLVLGSLEEFKPELFGLPAF